MTYKYKYSLISLSITAIVGFATLATVISYRPANNAIIKLTAIPDAYMEDVVAIIMDKQGKPSIKIVTPKLVHYAENDTTQLTAPQLTLYRKSPQPWYITANHAKATQGLDNVNFWENVIIHHAADQNNPATVIKTPTLNVQPDQQVAQTKDFITVIQPNLVVNATGMYADMNSGDIKLLSQARGEYAPDS